MTKFQKEDFERKAQELVELLSQYLILSNGIIVWMSSVNGEETSFILDFMNEICAALNLLFCSYFIFKISQSINNYPSFKYKLRTK